MMSRNSWPESNGPRPNVRCVRIVRTNQRNVQLYLYVRWRASVFTATLWRFGSVSPSNLSALENSWLNSAPTRRRATILSTAAIIPCKSASKREMRCVHANNVSRFPFLPHYRNQAKWAPNARPSVSTSQVAKATNTNAPNEEEKRLKVVASDSTCFLKLALENTSRKVFSPSSSCPILNGGSSLEEATLEKPFSRDRKVARDR